MLNYLILDAGMSFGSQNYQNDKVILVKKQMVSYFNSKMSALTLDNYDYSVMFKCIKPSRLMTLFEALLLNLKIILVHNNHGILAIIIECLKSLIKPLKWYSPSCSFLLGPDSFEFMDSPFSFIYGFSRKHWDRDIMMNVDQFMLDQYFFENAVIYEIDKDYLRTQVKTSIPKQMKNILDESLHKILNDRNDEIKNMKFCTPQQEQFLWKLVELNTKRLFLEFLMVTLHDFERFYKPKSEIKSKNLSSENIFNFDDFILSFPKEEQDFIQKFTMTQSFNVFIEESYEQF